jgi:predicted DNA-binding ribbon-helix-helix protein
MNTLRLEIINLHAPYRVKQREDKPQHYYFRTDYGVEYDISLEEEFYEEFLNIAAEMKMSRNQLITHIDSTRKAENLSSAVRLFVLQYYKEKSAAPK